MPCISSSIREAQRLCLKIFQIQVIDASFERWEDFFRYVLESEDVVIFDEFQNFQKVDPSVFSILQKVWDDLDSRVLLVLVGSHSELVFAG